MVDVFVVDVSERLEAKLAALACYESQFGPATHNAGLTDAVELAARTWGSTIGVAAGEPFFAEEPVGIVCPDVLA